MVLVVPVFIFLLFAVFEFGLLMFTLGESRWSAAEGARVVSEQGILAPNCTVVVGCNRLDAPTYAGKLCDADCQALSTINLGPLGTTSIATVDEIDITKLRLVGGSLTPDTVAPCICTNAYELNGKKISISYPTSGRNVTLAAADYAQVVIKFHYNWKTGLFAQFKPPTLTATYDVKLEPQRF